MTPAAQIILSGVLTFGVPLALAVRDLITLRRGSGGGGWPSPPQAPPPPRPNLGSPPVRRELPACLIPVRSAPLPELRPEPRPKVREFA
jgi:hypothetical protein